MRRQFAWIVLVTCATGMIVIPDDVTGRMAEQLYSTATPELHIWAHPLRPGYSGGSGAGGTLLPKGGPGVYLAAGSNEAPDLCAVSSGDYAPSLGRVPPAGAFITWLFTARLRSSDSSGAVIHLQWKRVVGDPAAANAISIERTYNLSLSERNRVVIDLVRRNEQNSRDCEGVAIEAELTFRDAPDLANSLLQYDVWLVDTDASGTESTDHVEPRGLQGREIEYAFRPLKFDVDGNRNSSGPVSSRLEGSVKGRVRPDGRIDLVLGVMRSVQSGSLGIGDGGGKQVTVSDGETVELTTPRLPGDVPGVPADSNLFRAGHTAIRVTVRRIS